MHNLRKLGYLHEQIGDTRFAALIDSINIEKVKAFCDSLLPVLPVEITLGDRVYAILSFHREGETVVSDRAMVQRAQEMNAHRGEADVQWFLNHQDDIPEALRNRVVFIFTDCRDYGVFESVCRITWEEGSRRWTRGWCWVGSDWDGDCRLLLRK